ncbi:MAG: YjbQ family protein [Ectothiorhodospiraceae bacterium]|nr:YjbQ family protein [Ectothiorhodospiraceae bacterium]
MYQQGISIRTAGRELREMTADVAQVVRQSGVKTGLCHVFIHHTSASLILSENADPSVCRDLERFMARLVPDGDPLFEHAAEGPDDMPAHVRSVLTRSDLTIPVTAGRLGLGTWQGIWLWEHRHQSNHRRITVTVQGE